MRTVRESVLEFVRRYPAVHAREVERSLGLSDGLASYHLVVLAREGRVTSFADGGFLRFVLRGPKAKGLSILALVRRPVVLPILRLLARDQELSHGAIAEHLGYAKASVTHHLRTLVEAGIVESRTAGRQRFFGLRDAEAVRRILRRYPPVPSARDRYERLWEDLFPRRRGRSA